MNVRRAEHQSVTLGDGRVLVAGGDHGYGGDTAELFDPVTETWSLTGRMSAWRTGFSLTLLADGRVLAAGGSDDNLQGEETCEIYDPTTERWSPTGRLRLGRFYHTATLLNSGEILAAGGVWSSYMGIFAVTNTAELFAP
jgi:hypothetical protein